MKGYYDAYDDSLDEECPSCADEGIVGIVNNGVCNECGWEAPDLSDLEPTDEDMDKLMLRGTLL